MPDFHLQPTKQDLPRVSQQGAHSQHRWKKDTLLLTSNTWTRLSPARPKLMPFGHIATPSLHMYSRRAKDFYPLGKQLSRLPISHVDTTPSFLFLQDFFHMFITDVCHSSSNTEAIYYTLIQMRDEHVNLQDVQPLAHVLFQFLSSSVTSPPSSTPGYQGSCSRRLPEHSESYKKYIFI